MLTPRDLLNVQFKTSFRGYNEQQVDEFMKKLVTAYEALYRENQELKRELEAARGQSEKLRTDQRRVDELIELARRAVEEAQEMARREADAILHEARVMAAQEREKVKAQYRETLERVRDLERQEAFIRERIRLLLQSLLSQLEGDPLQPSPRAGDEEEAAAEPEDEADELLADWVERDQRDHEATLHWKSKS